MKYCNTETSDLVRKPDGIAPDINIWQVLQTVRSMNIVARVIIIT
jgi:hypothetical protein